jgi:adenine-specific DNA methylase
MTRLIERWFPCEDVSNNSGSGWGSGNSEKMIFTWFAARPLVQAKAAVVCSMLPWPDEEKEQRRLQALVRRSLTGRDAAHKELVEELARHYPNGASMLDPFSGRAMIPLEAARLSIEAWGIDLSPVATLAGTLLADYPLRDWSEEPPVPFVPVEGHGQTTTDGSDRLLQDVSAVFQHIGMRYEEEMDEFYPVVDGRRPWGYLWSVTLPCQECGNRFPLTGSLTLRYPLPKKNDPGQSYRLHVDGDQVVVEVHEGEPRTDPTLVSIDGTRGKSAICPFCEHVHTIEVHTRLMNEGLAQDSMLLVADLDSTYGKLFREPTTEDLKGVAAVSAALAAEKPFAPGLPARPQEMIPAGNNDTVRPSKYGYQSYGDLCNDRQTLGFVRLSKIIGEASTALRKAGVSDDYRAALCGYTASALVRKLRRSTRGSVLEVSRDRRRSGVADIFKNEASVNFSYDYFETACYGGPGTWESVSRGTLSAVEKQLERHPGRPAVVRQGSALALPLPAGSVGAVITDPPYEAMIDYADASDLFYVWIKRALATSHPALGITADPYDLQDKTEEIIVKRGGTANADHRDKGHYDKGIADAFAEAARVVHPEGVVTIIFGHGDPEVWHRLLTSLKEAGLVLTGSWPARTEKGGKAGSANIETTITLSCRPAPVGRKAGRVAEVDAEVRAEILDRIPLWDAAGLALTDQLMASAGPAMEVVGRYSEVLDRRGEPVELDRYLPFARRCVEEAADIRIDALPLGTFDDRTRFALFWVRLYGRNVAAASEGRWQRLATDLSEDETASVLVKAPKGVRLAYGREADIEVHPTSSTIEVAMAMAAAGKSLASAAEILIDTGRTEDQFLWAALGELSRRLPEADDDGDVFTWLIRNRQASESATRNVEATRQRELRDEEDKEAQASLFDKDGA